MKLTYAGFEVKACVANCTPVVDEQGRLIYTRVEFILVPVDKPPTKES